MNVGGVEVHLEGNGAETIVMIHGWPDTYRLWDGTVTALKGQYRCARFTLPGFVDPKERRGYSITELSELVGKIVDGLVGPTDKVILLVHDWGCMVGYQYYARNPQRVSKVVGVDIGDPKSLRREITPSAMMGVLGYQLFLAAAWKIGGSIGDGMARWMARRMRCPSDFSVISSAMCWPYYMVWFGGWKGEVKAFRPDCPMLYLYAKHKPFMFHAPSWLEYLKSRRGNEVIGFDTGHWIMQADPQGFNQAVTGWLGALPGASRQ